MKSLRLNALTFGVAGNCASIAVLSFSLRVELLLDLAEITDEELVNACGQGDSDAWAALVARYQRLIYSIPRRAGLDEDIAADVLQHTFLKLLENITKIKQPSQIHAWLVTTARRQTLYILRGGKREVSLEGDDETLGFDVEAKQPLADEALMELERQHLVRTAVANLDERCKQLIVLLFYQKEQIAYSDISSTLGISEGSIGPNRARCLEKLKRMLKERS